MSLLSAWTVSFLMVVAAAEAQAVNTPAPVGERPSGNKDERVARAFSDYEKQRFDSAALEFEGLWQEFKEPRFLFNAAASRVGARHHAHAVAYLSEYLEAPGLTPEDRKEAEAQRTASLRETVAARVEIEAPADRAAVEFSVQHVPKLAADIRPALVFVASQVEGTRRARVVDLDPGEWKVSVKVEGFQPVEVRTQVVSGGTVVVRAALVPVPISRPAERPAGLPEEVRGKFVRGAAALGGVVLVGGIGVTAAGGVGFGRKFAAEPEACRGADFEACRQGLSTSGTLRSAGAGVLGAGVGVAVAGLSGLIRDGRRRKTAWTAEAAVGGAVTIGGLVWSVVAARGFNAANKNLDPMVGWDDAGNQSAARSGAARHTAAAAVLGLGAGMLVGGVSGVLLERAFAKGPRAAALRVGGGASPTWSGVVVSGKF